MKRHACCCVAAGMAHSFRLSCLMVLSFITRSTFAHAGSLFLAGPVDDVAAVGDLLAVVRGAQVLVLDMDGRPLFHLDPDVASFAEGNSRVPGRFSEDVRELYDVPEEDSDEPYAE